MTPDLAEALSRSLKATVVAFNNLDGDFCYWLYDTGRLIDRHPPGFLSRLFSRPKRIMGLCPNTSAREKADALLLQPPGLDNLTQFQEAIGIQYGQMLFSDFDEDEAGSLPADVMRSIVRTGGG
jgi:hypothetical protein